MSIAIGPVLTATGLALTPVVIWLAILHYEMHREKFRTMILLFIVGVFTVIPILLLQYVTTIHPDLSIFGYAESKVTNPAIAILFQFIFFGILEELVKARGVIFANNNLFTIKDIRTAIKFSLIIALGFAFTENIFKFYTTITGPENIFITVMTIYLRGTISVLGHMTFSGIFGYFYGVGQFSEKFMEEEKWMGKHYTMAHIMHKLFGIDKAKVIRQEKKYHGLLIAGLLHALFNILLEKNFLIAAISLVLTGALYIIFLLRKQSVYVPLTMDVVLPSLIKKQDEEVILELLGMWYREEKYQDVIEVCDRLLRKDPSNGVVKLFRAHALEKKKFAHLKRDLHALFSKEELRTDDIDQSTITQLAKKG